MNRREWMQWLAKGAAAAGGMTLYPIAKAQGRQYEHPSPMHTPKLPADYGPHPDFKNEWWYFTGWFTSPTLPAPFGMQVTFFRNAPDVDTTNPSRFNPTQLIIGHAAVSLPSKKRLLHAQKVARASYTQDYIRSGDKALDLQLSNWSLRSDTGASWQCEVLTDQFQVQWNATQTQKPWFQGLNGFSQKGPKLSESSYYITLPHLAVKGSLQVDGKSHAFEGSFWMDHEWSSTVLSPNAAGWDWVGLQGDSGQSIMAFRIRPKNPAEPSIWRYAAKRHGDGRLQVYNQVKFETLEQWQSPRTGIRYPVSQALHLDDETYTLHPLFADQELDARASSGNQYWEGAVRVTGPSDNQPWGKGYLEMTGYDRPMSL